MTIACNLIVKEHILKYTEPASVIFCVSLRDIKMLESSIKCMFVTLHLYHRTVLDSLHTGLLK